MSGSNQSSPNESAEEFRKAALDYHRLDPPGKIKVTATKADGSTVEFEVVSRLDTPVEVQYYRNGGILHTVLRSMREGKAATA